MEEIVVGGGIAGSSGIIPDSGAGTSPRPEACILMAPKKTVCGGR